MIHNFDETIEYFEKNDIQGIDLELLSFNTKIKVHTNNSIYEFVIAEQNKATVQGGKLFDGTLRFSEPTAVTLLGASWGSGIIKANWIIFEMRFEFVIDNIKKFIKTSAVKNITIEGPNRDWEYKTNWGTDLSKFV